jgi:hypothetical protein
VTAIPLPFTLHIPAKSNGEQPLIGPTCRTPVNHNPKILAPSGVRENPWIFANLGLHEENLRICL